MSSEKRSLASGQRYTEKVMDHFLHPRNMGRMKNFSSKGEVGNPVCGDLMTLYIKIGKNKQGEEIISDISFETLGCGAAIATSSIITELAKGKTIKEALKISDQRVAQSLGGLPPAKMHCSNLAASALQKAIENYKKKGDS